MVVRRGGPKGKTKGRSVETRACIEARGLRKSFGTTVALDGIDLRIDEGRILGLIGPNGAGKTTALNAMLGLIPYEGELRVLGRDPWKERDRLMRDVCFIADIAVLPRWIRVSNALDYVAGVHPRFDRAKAEAFLAKTSIKTTNKVRELSKGMVAQLHLALVMAIDARLLVLDEPTLGLDILYRKQFYDSLLNDYFDGNRTIVVTTHQVEEMQHVLTDLIAPATIPAIRVYYWSVRRELWENRSIYIAPLVAAVVFLFGFLVNIIHVRRHPWRGATRSDTAARLCCSPGTN